MNRALGGLLVAVATAAPVMASAVHGNAILAMGACAGAAAGSAYAISTSKKNSPMVTAGITSGSRKREIGRPSVR